MATMFIKLAGISAALAAIFVVALEVPSAQSRVPAKVYHDRVPTEAVPAAGIRTASAEPTAPAAPDVVPVAARPAPNCRAQAWPYVDQGCMSSERRPVRTITIERRDAPNTSNLVRIPVATH